MRDIIIIVDESDNIITHKKRDSIDSLDIYRVSALLVENSKGDFLLARRGFNKKNNPGKWGPAVAGTNEIGETYQSNIIKEIYEEIGLTNIELVKGDKIRRKGKNNYFCQIYHSIINKNIDEFNIDKNEVEEIKWFTKQGLIDEIDKNPDEFLRIVKELINSKV